MPHPDTYPAYRTLGAHEMVTVGIEALESIRPLLATLGEDAEVAEIRIYENMPIEILVVDEVSTRRFHWNRWQWLEVS